MLKAGIVGAAGYAGAELVRIILRHPEFELCVPMKAPRFLRSTLHLRM